MKTTTLTRCAKGAVGGVDTISAPSVPAILFEARLDVRCCVAFAKRLLDFVFDCARDLMPLLDVPIFWNHDVKIDPVISAAVAMAKFVIRADVRRFCG